MMKAKMKQPKHVGIIMDGNRRFAKRLMQQPWKGHGWGKKKLLKVCEWAKELGVKEMTFYAFSMQNFHRPKKEFDYLMQLFDQSLDEMLRRIRDKDKAFLQTRICFIGRIRLFNKSIQDKMFKVMSETVGEKRYVLNFAMAYGGREEIIDAINRIIFLAKAGLSKIDEGSFAKFLYMKSEPDMIIRTSGEKRLSNFLLWQSSYAELFFLDKMWPEFSKRDLQRCIKEYGERGRRFGR